MRILYFLAHPNSIGGAMKVLMTQAYIMQTHGNCVRVVIQNNDEGKHIPEYEKLCNMYGLDYVTAQYPIATCIENIDILKSLDHYGEVKELIENFLPDIVHSVQLNTIVEYVTRELGIPHLMNVYQVSEGMFNIKWMDIFPRYHCGDTIFFSEKWRAGLGIESRCISSGYEMQTPPKLENKTIRRTTDAIELINIAHLTEYKRQMEIIKFVEKCKLEGYNVHINMIGSDEGQYAQDCKVYVKENNLDREVSFTGSILNIEDYLSNADLMVHISISESYPTVFIMAMCYHVPVLTAPTAGIPEVIKDGVNGFLTAGYTYNDLFEAFKRYIFVREKGKIGILIKNAYETYLLNNTYDAIYKGLNEYYRKMLSDKTDKAERFSSIGNTFNLIINYGKNIGIEYCMEETKAHLWFIYHIKDIITQNGYRTAKIWGAGHYGKVAIEWCKILSLNIVGIIDSFKEGDYDGYRIERPSLEKILDADVVFLAIANVHACEQNIKLLEKAGKKRNVDYFLMCNNPCFQLVI